MKVSFSYFRTSAHVFVCSFNCPMTDPQDRRKLLQQWVESEQDPSCIEADLVISKSTSKKKRGTKELLTTTEMMKREIPMEKIRAIVAKGKGIPDEDCPEIASLTRFWINTSTQEIDEDEAKQEQRVKVAGTASSGIDAVFSTADAGSMGALGADKMQSILEGLPSAEGLGVGMLYSKKLVMKSKSFIDYLFLNLATHPSTLAFSNVRKRPVSATRKCTSSKGEGENQS